MFVGATKSERRLKLGVEIRVGYIYYNGVDLHSLPVPEPIRNSTVLAAIFLLVVAVICVQTSKTPPSSG